MKKNKKIEAAQESLEDILKRIKPYMPKHRKVKEKPARTWQIVDSHVLPPPNSLRGE